MLHKRKYRCVPRAANGVDVRGFTGARDDCGRVRERVCGRSDSVGTKRSVRAAELVFCRAPEQEGTHA